MKHFAIFFLILLILASCQTLNSIRIVGRYSLESDEGRNYILVYNQNDDSGYLILVDLFVYSAGVSNNYIILRQHPKVYDKMETITKYFIVPIYKNFTTTPEKGIIGPLTKEQFDIKKKELKISDFEFTIK
jgi:hypothetical protein